MRKLLLLTCLLSLWSALPALAHEEQEIEAQTDLEARDDHEEHEHHGSEFGRAFAEGTPNLFSPATVEADSLSLFYSHNFFSSTFPRSSNPVFWARYSPFEHLQIDGLIALRERPLEGEIGLSYQVCDATKGDFFNLTPRLSWNSRGNLFGAELAASKMLVPEIWQVGLDARFLSTAKPDGYDRMLGAVGANTLVRVWKHWHLFGDVVVPLDGEILQKQNVLWSVGIKKIIPHSPHILTLYAGNSQEQSLSGRTISSGRDLSQTFRVGFIFSIGIDEVSKFAGELF